VLAIQRLHADTMSVISQRPSKPELHTHRHIDAEVKDWIQETDNEDEMRSETCNKMHIDISEGMDSKISLSCTVKL